MGELAELEAVAADGLIATKVVHEYSDAKPVFGVKLTTLSSGKVNFELTIRNAPDDAVLDRMLEQGLAVAQVQVAHLERALERKKDKG